MSGQVAALVESTQLLWLMMRDAEKVLVWPEMATFQILMEMLIISVFPSIRPSF